jgi:hypothetical protein
LHCFAQPALRVVPHGIARRAERSVLARPGSRNTCGSKGRRSSNCSQLAVDVAITQWKLLPKFGGRALARSKKRYICVFCLDFFTQTVSTPSNAILGTNCATRSARTGPGKRFTGQFFKRRPSDRVDTVLAVRGRSRSDSRVGSKPKRAVLFEKSFLNPPQDL